MNKIWEQITISASKAVPKYKQLQAELERLIAGNILEVNTRLPGENEIFNKTGLSRTTIRKAFEALERSHLIYRVQGHGTFVGSKPASFSENGNNARSAKFKHLVGVLVPNITNEIYPFILNGIEKTFQSGQICVFSSTSNGNRERELQIINEMLNNSIEGLILEPLYSGYDEKDKRLVSLLEKLTIPVVLISNDIPMF